MSYILSKSLGYLRLVRPANLLTAVADILAGIAISGFLYRTYTSYLDLLPVACLCLATIGLYGGGVVFNDVFDASLDKTERPERPIPSGLVSKTQAVVLGSYLFLVGILAAFTVSRVSGFIALSIMASALVYDKWGKHTGWGPVNMGLCRGLNLLLGISLVVPVLQHYTWIAAIPVLYIAAVTAISRGEVYGGNIRTLRLAAVCYALVYGTIAVLAVMNGRLLSAAPFILLFMIMTNAPLIKAMKDPSGPNIGKAVKGGILALVAMNAAFAAAFTSLPYALTILVLLPLSLLLAKAFAVT
ncbi:UbiA-like protein EboC [Chitinophaga japonensis]|uniref:4-hydroxybenzoate polyprenyltransferase n=1 Tax=Chitinophaga japonensis TaxID=104662 RepID=A0A562TC49_CHIJA|nr:UbiA-like protein EboC [Chitinophaga japonensis]TWI91089.1 4-hydroxybenzoate polyprenyltransferase [Chitinophaga japonensis]